MLFLQLILIPLLFSFTIIINKITYVQLYVHAFN